MTTRRHQRPLGHFRIPMLLLVLVLVATACGTRLSDEERAEAKGRGGQLVRAGSGGGGDDDSAFDDDLEDGDFEAGDDAGGGDSTAGDPGTSGPSGPSSGGAGSGGGDGGGGDGDDSADSPHPRADTNAGSATGEPLVIGTVGEFSGPSGAAWKPMAEMLQVWARDVNGRGGIDGRPVKLSVVDDGGDPARHLSAIRNLVENEGAFAFSGNVTSNSYSQATRDYLEKNGIPVVGGDITQRAWDESPMFFPQGTSWENKVRSHVATAKSLRPQTKRWGQITCREAQGCQDAAEAWGPLVREYGMEVVYRGEASIAQPDYTAECLGARNADAEVLAVAVDPNSMRRVAQSCARQNYNPSFLLPSAVVASSQNGDSNLNGAIGVLATSPWMSKANPANAAMHQAVQRYAPNLKLNAASTMGWAAGLMLEKAVENAGGLGESASRERLIEGLYRFDGETLGGVSPPLTFRKGQPDNNPCWFAVEFKDGQWVAANDGKHLCP